MNIETLTKIGPYIYELKISTNQNIELLNIKHFYNLTSLNLEQNDKITDDGIRDLINLTLVQGRAVNVHRR